MKSLPRRAVSFQSVYDNVIDIIRTIVVNQRSFEYPSRYNAKVMFALTYSLTGYAKNDHLGRRERSRRLYYDCLTGFKRPRRD